MIVVEAFLVASLAGLLMVTVLVQLGHPRRLCRIVMAHNRSAIVPTWHFFAPDLHLEDWRIVYRHLIDDGSWTTWRQAAPRRCGLFQAVWNPEKRVRRALDHLCSALEMEPTPSVADSLPWRAVVNFVRGLPRSDRAVGCEFRVIRNAYGGAASEVEVATGRVHISRQTPPEAVLGD